MDFLLYWRDKRIGQVYSWGEVFSDPWIWMWLVIIVYGIFAARRKMKESKEEPFDGQKEQSLTPAAEKQEQEENAASADYLHCRFTLVMPVLGFCVSHCLVRGDWNAFGLLLILLVPVGALLVIPSLPVDWAKTSFAEDRKNGAKLDRKEAAKRSKGQLILFGAGIIAGILFGLLSL